MKSRYTLVLAIVASLAFTGCSQIMKADRNSIYVENDGTITEAIVEKFDKNYYSEDELYREIEAAVNSFNDSYGDDAIEIVKKKVSDSEAKVFLQYKNYENYVAFNNMELYVGDMASAVERGYDGSVLLTDPDGGKTTINDLIKEGRELTVVVATPDLQIETERNIAYASANLSYIEKKIVAANSSDTETSQGEAVYSYVLYEQ